jgi:hypothetical protein
VTPHFGGSTCVLTVQVEYRGKVWSIGGDEGAVSLPNYLRVYSPSLTGFSIGQHQVGNRASSMMSRSPSVHEKKTSPPAGQGSLSLLRL